MGIKPAALRLLTQIPFASVLSLSFPDMVMRSDAVKEITGLDVPETEDYGRWHARDHKLPSTQMVLAGMGAREIRYVDIVASRGCEEIADLNLPQRFGRYDLVLDAGTTEHCANIWVATVNAAHAVKDGGHIFHTVPLSMANHGFFCPQPTFYADLYQQNGWEIRALVASDGNECWNVNWTARFKCSPDLVLYVVAKRQGEQPLRLPTQTKCLRNPSLR